MYTLGSHNSFSYLPIKKWYMKWTRPWARCQTKTIADQLAEGVRHFDMRVRFNKDGSVRLVHNSIEFKAYNLEDSLHLINEYGCHMRLALDIRSKVGPVQERMFFEYVKRIQKNYPQIKLHVQIAARGWTDIPEWSAEPFEIAGDYVSMAGYSMKNLIKYWGIPELYARRNNKNIKKKFKGNCLCIDFV